MSSAVGTPSQNGSTAADSAKDDKLHQQMVEYWHNETTTDVHSNAEISKLEVVEILNLLPELKKKQILELGGGKGRFTGFLADEAESVTCVDFVEKFLDSNRSSNADKKNVAFKCVDVTKLDETSNEYDVVFSNGLLMYLGETEVRDLFEKILKCLRCGGHFFFCESCFSPPKNEDLRSRPAVFRLPDVYNSLFQSVSVATEDGQEFYSFEIVFSKSIQAFIEIESNCNQICWLLTKVRVATSDCHGYKTFQEFLDKKQYSRTGILRYERIFGDNFVSTGGIDTTEEFVKLLDLKPKQRVLDVGAGIGGGDFYMAEKYDVDVLGIDLSSNMISIALERANNIKDIRVQFEVCDATKRIFPSSSFDVVYSRDTILHIADKKQLFASFYKWLKPGGRLLISDYCCCDGDWSKEFTEYVEQRGYNLLSVKQYGQLLEDIGFTNVRAEDRTKQFVEMLEKELLRIKDIREGFIKEFSEPDHDYLVDGWNDKLRRCGGGSQKWGLFYAEKPTAV